MYLFGSDFIILAMLFLKLQFIELRHKRSTIAHLSQVFGPCLLWLVPQNLTINKQLEIKKG